MPAAIQRPLIYAIDPLAGAPNSVNFPRYLDAKINRFEGSYTDFLQHGYRWYGDGPQAPRAPSSSPPVLPPNGEPNLPANSERVAFGVALLAALAYWTRRYQAVCAQIVETGTPTKLRCTQQPTHHPGQALEALAKATTGAQRQRQRLVDLPVMPQFTNDVEKVRWLQRATLPLEAEMARRSVADTLPSTHSPRHHAGQRLVDVMVANQRSNKHY